MVPIWNFKFSKEFSLPNWFWKDFSTSDSSEDWKLRNKFQRIGWICYNPKSQNKTSSLVYIPENVVNVCCHLKPLLNEFPIEHWTTQFQKISQNFHFFSQILKFLANRLIFNFRSFGNGIKKSFNLNFYATKNR
jgi:hypothetical protein